MSRIRIKLELWKRGITQRQIALALNVSEAFISQWLNNKKTSSRVEEYVSSLLGKRAA